jgi:hypothetical protein
MATMTLKGTGREPKNTITSTTTLEMIAGMMGGRTCGDSPNSHGKLLCGVDLYIC